MWRRGIARKVCNFHSSRFWNLLFMGSASTIPHSTIICHSNARRGGTRVFAAVTRREFCINRLFFIVETAVNFKKMLLAILSYTILSGASPVFAQSALDDVMKAKLIKIAIPTDFPPYGFVGTDLKPQGLDIDMANYIGAKLGAKVELVISTLGKNAEREKVIDFTAAYSPFFQAVFGPKTLTIKSAADLAGKTIAVTRGAIEDMELTKIAPPNVDIKRFEDNNTTVAAFVSGQVQLIATGASVAGNMMQKNPKLNTEYKLLIKDSPNFKGVAKGEDKLRLKVNEILAAAKKAGDLDKMAQQWLGRPAGDLPN